MKPGGLQRSLSLYAAAMSRAAIVVPYLMEASQRFVNAVAKVPGVRLALITHEPLENIPEKLKAQISGHWRVDNALDWRQLVTAGRGIAQQLGGLDRMIGVLEHMQVALAQARAELGLEGLDPESANNFRDKARMKEILRRSGLPCARHCLAGSAQEAVDFGRASGYPLVAKPPAGAGAKSTYRLDDERALIQMLEFSPSLAEQPVLLEEFVQGEEHSFDGVMVDGRLVWHSISHYAPSPLDVLRNSWIQWCVLLPRDIAGAEFDDIREAGFEAVHTLGLRTGFFHMEWFRRPDGTIAISEVAARPPGAQITTLMSLAHDFDLYEAWGDLMVRGRFEPPERRYAAGAAYLRGMGKGRVARVHGVDTIARSLGDLIVEAKLPQVGQHAASGYEGEGYVLVRHPKTETVRAALREIVSTIRVELEE
jgi:phosphoribosylaminoimidazole carboxylase (NCAIR synthetase)